MSPKYIDQRIVEDRMAQQTVRFRKLPVDKIEGSRSRFRVNLERAVEEDQEPPLQISHNPFDGPAEDVELDEISLAELGQWIKTPAVKNKRPEEALKLVDAMVLKLKQKQRQERPSA